MQHMERMFRLPWCPEAPREKMEQAALHDSRPLPVFQLSTCMNKIKRKRTDSPEPASPHHSHVVKKSKNVHGEVKPAVIENGSVDRGHVVDGLMTNIPKAANASVHTPQLASAEVLESRPKAQPSKKEGANRNKMPRFQKPAAKPEPSSADNPTPTMGSDLTRAQQAIEAQFSYEILLKHNELRLIEQELAKCQVALEQLRRCSLIPYPGSQGLSENVSGGVGPALQPPHGYTEPEHPAPWGVTDGPYARHYAKWLIQDPKFDSIPLAQQSQGYFGAGEGRATRGSFAEFGSTGKARTSRTSTGTLKLQALGETPAPAPKVDPLLHKRSTDGQWVRLYCAQCGHSNFSNTQGFLNHCRIKHNQVFKSHDQAAIACGVPVDLNETGNPVSAVEPPSATVSTPAATFPPPTTPGFVHPLIRTNPTELAKDVYRDFNKPACDQTSQPAPIQNPGFVGAPSMPHMNALLKKTGFDGNLQQMVETARTKIDLNSMETSDDEMVDTIVVKTSTVPLTRLPASAPGAAPASKTASARPGSKQQSKSSGHARLPISVPPPVRTNGTNHLPDSPVDLSPNTVEPNPGLVSDHDDDDEEDGYDARSQPDLVMDDDVLVEDASDVEGVEERTGSRKGLGGCFEKGEGSRKH